MKHECPIELIATPITLDCPCRQFYSVKQIEEWIHNTRADWHWAAESFVKHPEDGIAKYFAKKGVVG